jgi:hypothetical protein
MSVCQGIRFHTWHTQCTLLCVHKHLSHVPLSHKHTCAWLVRGSTSSHTNMNALMTTYTNTSICIPMNMHMHIHMRMTSCTYSWTIMCIRSKCLGVYKIIQVIHIHTSLFNTYLCMHRIHACIFSTNNKTQYCAQVYAWSYLCICPFQTWQMHVSVGAYTYRKIQRDYL